MQADALVLMWRRLDQPGHEVMRFADSGDGYRLEGFDAYRENERHIGLQYRVEIGADWTARSAAIEGHLEGRPFAHRIVRGRSKWTVDGAVQHGLGDVPHLDFGFTPATNMPQLRYEALAIGESRTFDVAWFDIGRDRLERLSQIYRNVGDGRFEYESPQGGYAAVLELAPDGFTTLYPDLWERVGG